MEFVQVHVRTNVSDPFPEKIVRERLGGAIRLLRGATAGFRFYGMNVRCFLGGVIVFSPFGSTEKI